MADEMIRIEGLQELIKLVTDLEQLKPIKASLKAAGLYLKGRVAVYPAQTRPTRESVYGSSFKTEKQRRFFFAALKKGEIDVPYRRGASSGSETFGRRWTVGTTNNGLRVMVGNNASYGPLLMDEEKQSLYARAVGWRTVQAIMKEERDKVTEIVADGLQRAIRGAQQ
jgi:hypothetical protein